MVRVSRRDFLKTLAGTTAGALLLGKLELYPDVLADSPLQALPPFSFSSTVVRADDFLALRFDFYNLALEGVTTSPSVGAATLVPVGQPAYIVVNLPPQNIAERAFYEVGTTNGEETISATSAYPIFNPPSLFPSACRTDTPYTSPTLAQCLTSNGIDFTTLPGGSEAAGVGSETPTLPGTVQSQLSGWSRLVFVVPSNVTSIPYTLPGLLQAISTYDLSVTPTAAAVPPPSPTIGSPASTETAIEAPYRLMISPTDVSRWAHSPTPVTRSNRTELWHTRLAVQGANLLPDEMSATNPTIRAVWTPDFEALSNGQPTNCPPNPNTGACPPNPNCPGDKVTHYAAGAADNGPPGFRMSVDNRDRNEIVHSTSNYQIPSYTPTSASVSRLHLSSLGALIDLDWRWDINENVIFAPNLSVTEWRHLATMGRDHYVKVVYAGWLAPFGHHASLVKVTERKFVVVNIGTFAPENVIVAYLKQRMYIVVREPVKTYPALGQPWNGRNTPFQSLQITTLVTPPLWDPASTTSAAGFTAPGGRSSVAGYGQDAFWPQVPSPTGTLPQDFLFHFIATDWDGNTCQFSAPLIFVDNSLGTSALTDVLTNMATPNGYVNNDNLALRRTVQMRGQKIAFTKSYDPTTNTNTGKSSYEASTITWMAEFYNASNFPPDEPPDLIPPSPGESYLTDNDLPVFFPALDNSQVRIASVQELAGGNPTIPPANNTSSPAISYYGGPSNGYLWYGLNYPSGSPTNKGGVFATLQSFDPTQPVPPTILQPNTLTPGVRVDLSQNVEKLGGIVTPSVNYVGVALNSGVVPGDVNDVQTSLDNLATGTGFDPTTALLNDALSQAKILGGIPLTSIFAPITGATIPPLGMADYGDGIRVPKIVAKVEYDASGKPVYTLITLHWEPPLQSWDPFSLPNGGPPGTSGFPLFDVQNTATPPNPPAPPWGTLQSPAPIVIDAQLMKSFDPSTPPTFTVTGIINGPINLNLVPGGSGNPLFVISIPFNKVQFTLQSGGKTNVSANLGQLSFHGILSFVQTLDNILSGLGLGDPPYLDVNSSGITTGLNIGVPTIPIGALIISDIALDLSLNIPFIGDPARLRFSISTREQPFTITYTIFGGGGFFGVGLGLDGFEMFEASFEFGAFLSLDLGVASGSAHAAVGIYFQMSQIAPNSNTTPNAPPPSMIDDTEITGFCSIGGELEVLGIITVSTEFYMSISYDSATNTCEGQASLTVEVDVLMFHEAVMLGPIEKKFSTDPNPQELPFGYLVPAASWSDYTGAFA